MLDAEADEVTTGLSCDEELGRGDLQEDYVNVEGGQVGWGRTVALCDAFG